MALLPTNTGQRRYASDAVLCHIWVLQWFDYQTARQEASLPPNIQQEEKKEMDESDDGSDDDTQEHKSMDEANDSDDGSDDDAEPHNQLNDVSCMIVSFHPGPRGAGRVGSYKIAVRDGAVKLGEPETEQIIEQFLSYVFLYIFLSLHSTLITT